jgi:hypothetical protein
MIDPALLEELRRFLSATRLAEWQRDLVENVPDRLVRQIAQDFRNFNPHPAQDPRAKVVPQGAGKVVTPGEVEAPQDRSGWRDSPQLRQPDGVNYVDALCDDEDRRFRAQRIRELAGTQHSLKLAEAAKEAAAKAEDPNKKGPGK